MTSFSHVNGSGQKLVLSQLAATSNSDDSTNDGSILMGPFRRRLTLQVPRCPAKCWPLSFTMASHGCSSPEPHLYSTLAAGIGHGVAPLEDSVLLASHCGGICAIVQLSFWRWEFLLWFIMVPIISQTKTHCWESPFPILGLENGVVDDNGGLSQNCLPAIRDQI